MIAAILSLIVPGLGQLYNGYLIRAILWFLAVGVGYYMLIVPGVILHICCVIFAALEKPKRR